MKVYCNYYFSSSPCLAHSRYNYSDLSPHRCPPHRNVEVRRGGRQEPLGKYLMLIPKVTVQFLRMLGLIVAELAFVRFQFIVLFYVLLEALITGAGEGTFITAENNSLQVF